MRIQRGRTVMSMAEAVECIQGNKRIDETQGYPAAYVLRERFAYIRWLLRGMRRAARLRRRA